MGCMSPTHTRKRKLTIKDQISLFHIMIAFVGINQSIFYFYVCSHQGDIEKQTRKKKKEEKKSRLYSPANFEVDFRAFVGEKDRILCVVVAVVVAFLG